MARNLRSGDILGRWGGEEFIVACVDFSAEHAAVVAEKIRQRIEASAFSARQRIPDTASFGVAAVLGAVGFAEALKRADAALYRAKSLGRNRVVMGTTMAMNRPGRWPARRGPGGNHRAMISGRSIHRPSVDPSASRDSSASSG